MTAAPLPAGAAPPVTTATLDASPASVPAPAAPRLLLPPTLPRLPTTFPPTVPAAETAARLAQAPPSVSKILSSLVLSHVTGWHCRICFLVMSFSFRHVSFPLSNAHSWAQYAFLAFGVFCFRWHVDLAFARRLCYVPQSCFLPLSPKNHPNL